MPAQDIPPDDAKPTATHPRQAESRSIVYF